MKRTIEDLRSAGFPDETLEELLKMLEERLKEQTEEHNGGNYWVGTQGRTPWGNSGWHPNGIRIGGQSMHRTAMMVAGERKFRDFRKDNTLDTRQFQMAFRTLRQLSAQERSAEQEVDVDATIYCEKASHKGIIIGKQGAMLKKISSLARADMEKFMGTKVFLQTWVKVKENWRDNVNYVRSLGYRDE